MMRMSGIVSRAVRSTQRAKAVEALANAETFLRQSRIPSVLDIANRTRLLREDLATLRGTLIGGGRK
jgi:hypothetical protein